MPRKKNTKTAIAAPASDANAEKNETPIWLTAALATPPLTPDALHDWLQRVLDIRIARTPLLPGHSAPFDFLCHTFFEGNIPRPDGAPTIPSTPSPDAIVWANRGGGKTLLGALATLLDLLFKPGIQVRILGGSLDQSLRMREHLVGFLLSEHLDHVPKRIAARRITILREGKKQNSVAEVLAASQTSVRGTRVQKLRCDEVELFDPEVWQAAQLVTRSLACDGPWGPIVRGSVEALSTMHRPYGLMWNLVGPVSKKEAESKAARPPRTIFKWGVLDVLEHCTDEHTCATCILYDECQGRAKTHITPANGGHISIPDAIGMKARASKDTWDSEMLCLRPSRSDTVYPDFDMATHVVGDDPDRRLDRFIGGMDFGIRSEGVLLLAGIDAGGVVVVLREHIRTGVVLDDYIDALERWIAEGICTRDEIDFIGVDPAGRAKSDQTGKSCIDILKSRALRIRARPSDPEAGIRFVQARIAPAWVPRHSVADSGVPRHSVAGSGVPRRSTADSGVPRRSAAGSVPPHAHRGLLIHHSCIRLIECLTLYRYDPNRPESTTPLKDGHDHAPDALRYMIHNLDATSKIQCESYT